jgi:glycine cleavage system transcriptional repressor
VGTRHFALSAVGDDRPGIVAGVTGPLVRLGCNLEDTSMTVLRGRFAMVLIVAGPEALDAGTIEAALRPDAERLDLAVWVHDVAENVPAAAQGESWTVSVHGADRPGIVHEVARLLAGAGANIIDLSTRVLPGDPQGWRRPRSVFRCGRSSWTSPAIARPGPVTGPS